MTDNKYRADFPIFEKHPCVYLDSAATAQRPKCVIEAEKEFYETMNANPLRGLYDLSVKATDAYERSREEVAAFIGAESPEEIIFTRNTSESLNLVAYSYAMNFLKPGDEIVTTVMEHHSNMLPWQMAAEKTGAKLLYLEPDAEGNISDDELATKINDHTRLIAVGHVSNVLGCENPVRKIADRAHRFNAVVVVDGAQSAPHMKVDINELGADFFAFSGHKLMGPMGIGVLYGKKELLEKMPPFLVGGEMIESVTLKGAVYAELPHKFEAGTVNAAGAYALAAAIRYLEGIGFDEIRSIEDRLCEQIFEGLSGSSHIHIQGPGDPKKHNGIVSFIMDDVHPHDIASILDADGINIRAGHHCAQPLMEYLKVGSTARASVYLYNDEQDIQSFIEKTMNVRRWLGLES
ncbi:MAG: SufS family cysteine desulfurase [Lachnospiraceae bacterium]|nr:SufS family cysteine desulfurase [Lachnospiraceae bacterium]